nr:40S ribosomal protein SSA [Cryptomonas curvata]
MCILLTEKKYSDDIKKMILCNSHLGSKHCSALMKVYIWKKRKDGFFLINVSKIIDKIKLAARAIVAINDKNEIIVISNSSKSEKAVLKFSNYIGCQAMVGRWTPGKLTNQMCKTFFQPQLIILANPSLDIQPINEASYVNVPTIAFCNTDSSLNFIDIAIPGNTKGKHSVAFLWWLLTREVLMLKGEINTTEDWDVPLDFFLDKNNEEESISKNEKM